jgi:Undecaprenyl-phosphate glucose phosphotransferase
VTVASAASLSATFIHHVAIRHILDLLERTGRLRERVALFGSTRGTEHFLRLMAVDGDTPEIVGVFSDNPDDQNGRKLVSGRLEDLVSLSRRERVDVVVLTFAAHGKDALKAALDRLETTVADIVTVSFETPGYPNSRSVRLLGACPTAIIDERPIRDWNGIVKGSLDRTIAGLLLVLALPLLVCVSVAIKLDSPGPVLFKQRRRGFNDEIFEIFKFRTMHHAMRDLNADRLTERGDPRITRVGQWLRRTSIDELPQLLNVLRGEMSLVGPRPHPLGAKAGTRLYADILDNYSRRHRVKPGITGWAQVNGWRGETTNEEQIRQRVRHDLYYVKNWSLALDLKILYLTLCGGYGGKDVF